MALLTRAARATPLVLVIEDCQWADRSTRDFLAFLVRAARREPIALIVSYRSDELKRRHPLRPFVLELERSGRAIRLELGPFTRAELRKQVAGILDETPSPPLVDGLLERSEGNPFFTEELLASSRKPGEPLPASLRDLLLSRVEAQSSGVRDVLRTAAVAGRTIDHALLAAVTDRSEDDLNRALRDAVESYLLTHDSSGAGYSFRHALLREAIYADLLPGERRSLHLRLARALGEHPTGAAAAGLQRCRARPPLVRGRAAAGGADCVDQRRGRGREPSRARRGLAALRARARHLGSRGSIGRRTAVRPARGLAAGGRRGIADRRRRASNHPRA